MRFFRVFAFLVLGLTSIGRAQTPGGTWGPWSRLTAATTGMETRVKCEYSFQGDSMWAYQFKNLNDHTVDIVEKEQHGLANSRANGFGAAGMFTLDPGKMSYPYEGTMHGTCAQVHNLKIEFVCVVPHGQDHPCFKNLDGSTVANKSQESNNTPADNVASGNRSPKPVDRKSFERVSFPALLKEDHSYQPDLRLDAANAVGAWTCAFKRDPSLHSVSVLINQDGTVKFGPTSSTWQLKSDFAQLSLAYPGASARDTREVSWTQTSSSLDSAFFTAAGREPSEYREAYLGAFFPYDATTNDRLVVEIQLDNGSQITGWVFLECSR